jgi:hypothetical protein
MLKELLETFRPPSAHIIAMRELEEAQRELLRTQSAKEYAESMVTYHEARIARLTATVKEGAL